MSGPRVQRALAHHAALPWQLHARPNSRLSHQPLKCPNRSLTTARNLLSTSPRCHGFSGLRLQTRLQMRQAASVAKTDSTKKNFFLIFRFLFRHHTFETTLALTIMGAAVVLVGYGTYHYEKDVYGPITARYPEKAGNMYRRAIYYTNVDFNVDKAFEYFSKAQQACREAGMDQWSDEVIEIKAAPSDLYALAGNYPKAIGFLAELRKALLIQADAALTIPEERAPLIFRQKRRTRLLGKAIEVSLGLSKLFANPYVHKDTEALELILWTIDVVQFENASRQAVKATDETHGEFVSVEKYMTQMKALADEFDAENNDDVAAPLLLQIQAQEQGQITAS